MNERTAFFVGDMLIRPKQDRVAEWVVANPVLRNGELGVATDTGEMKLGNGVDGWDILPVWALIVVHADVP